MMLDHFGEKEIGEKLLDAIETVMQSGIKTGDIGGTSLMTEVTDAIISELERVL